MHITDHQASLLKKHGFKWLKNNCTDRVDAECIDKIIPTEDGFAVVYNDASVIAVSCAKIKEIEWPVDAQLNERWIMVHWESIEDQRKSCH